jgi:hypothetical protein
MNPKVFVLFRNDDLCAWSDPKREDDCCDCLMITAFQ